MAVQLLEAAEHSRTAGATLIWKFPRIVRNAFLVHAKAVLPRLLEHGIAGCMTEDAGAAGALLSTGTRPVLYGGAGLNIFNREAVRALAPPFSLLTLSPELSGDWIRVLLSRVPKQEAPGIGMLVQGSPEAMVAEDRLLSILAPPDAPGRICGLMDGTGRIFPVFQDSECRTRILNAVELCLIDHIPDIIAAGVGSLAIDARGRSPAYAIRAVAAYRQAVSSRAKAMPERASLLAALKGGMREISRGGITTGHYLRGVSEGDGVS
jgi:putative protease